MVELQESCRIAINLSAWTERRLRGAMRRRPRISCGVHRLTAAATATSVWMVQAATAAGHPLRRSSHPQLRSLDSHLAVDNAHCRRWTMAGQGKASVMLWRRRRHQHQRHRPQLEVPVEAASEAPALPVPTAARHRRRSSNGRGPCRSPMCQRRRGSNWWQSSRPEIWEEANSRSMCRLCRPRSAPRSTL